MRQLQAKISLREFLGHIDKRPAGIDCAGVSGAERVYLVSEIYRRRPAPMLVVTATPKEAERFQSDLRFFDPAHAAAVKEFPPYNILPFKFIAYHNETAARRIRTLYELLDPAAAPIVVTTVGALVQKIVPRGTLVDFAELIQVGEEFDRDALLARLTAGGYSRSVVVEEPGDYSVRGGIIDIFSPLYDDPVRIEMFGDLVESLRFFSAVSQRTIGTVDEIVVLPAKEAVLYPSAVAEVVSRVRTRAAALEMRVTDIRKLVGRLKQEGSFAGIESLLPLIDTPLETLLDYLPADTLPVLDDPGALAQAAAKAEALTDANYQAAVGEKRFCVEPGDLYLSYEDLLQAIGARKPLAMKVLPVTGAAGGETSVPALFRPAVEDNADVQAALQQKQDHDHLMQPLVDWIQAQLGAGRTTLLVCRSKVQADRLFGLLRPYGIPVAAGNGFDREAAAGLAAGRAVICRGEISSGFVWPDEHLAVITEEEIFGARRGARRRPTRPEVQTRLLAFEDLKTGDLVVHNEHGIGRYDGLIKLSVEGATNDFLLIIYREGDKLYLPVERMRRVEKYMGVDGITPTLDKMGGSAWQRVKERVKKSTEAIAGELLQLYAARKVGKGFAHKAADDYFRKFEAGFQYEETPDQLKAIEDVLADMAAPQPMDRLVCGDVGYGKTEVALRASFMAVYNGKQVAVLVPTTVLAEQHFATFSERFANYPVTVACLSRFRSAAEQRGIVADVKAGKVDIVVGTHRLLQRDVGFKDLGLIVLDEEQRFGVKHKEKLKKIRKTVDVLALTATPIPRTLHLSLMGIRDISVIATPPEFRHAIVTYICEFDDDVVVQAVRRELQRGGQVFFVHNNIHSIEKVAAHLQRLVPEARLGIAHGRLDEEDLEQVMLQFMQKKIDLLVCTTIIESGLDVSAANTILINRADRFGLAQIYQLRGRVGRADEQAYAYLFIPGESILGRDAQKRLKVLMEHSDLGAGFQIAMSDLKIRGGGTILGASQSGHIAAVGYDMFLKLMEESIAELKGDPAPEPLDPEINMSLSAFIPETYVPDIDQRLSAYRRLSRLETLNEIAELKEELIDRFGPLPEEAVNLFFKIVVKVLAVKAGVGRLDLVGKDLVLSFSEAHVQNPSGLVEMVAAGRGRFRLTPDLVLRTRLDNGALSGLLTQIKNILKEIAQRVND